MTESRFIAVAGSDFHNSKDTPSDPAAQNLFHNLPRGFYQNQNKLSGATSDLTSDKGKQGAGYAHTDDAVKKALKDMLKPHD